MITPELKTQIRRLFYAEHWKIGTIAAELGIHHDTVRRAIGTESFAAATKQQARARLTEPYEEFVRQILKQYPKLRATRIFEMVRQRGYTGSVITLRRLVATVRPSPREVFLRLRTFPAEQAQVDWASFGEVTIGRARRKLSCMALILSYSRALYLEFFFDQSLENFLRAHVRALHSWGGCPRTLLYDNLKSVVLERRGDAIRFHPRLLELAAHYHFAPRPCHVGRANEKGRIERALRFVRESFFAARPFTTLERFNEQAHEWLQQIAHQRPWPQDRSRCVAEVFAEERAKLLALPSHPFDTELMVSIHSKKTLYLRFDLNDYSIPPQAVGKALTLVADPAHQQALLAQKRKAWAAAPSDRLTRAAPEAEELLQGAVEKGESLSHQTRQLLLLLEDYGPEALRAALCQALERQTPRASAVAFLLQRSRRAGRTALPVDLSRHPELEALDVHPHPPEDYDELTQSEPQSE